MIAVVVLLGAALRLIAPPVIRQQLLSHLRTACPACQFKLEELDLSVIEGVVTGRDIEVISDPDDSTRFAATAAVLLVKASWTHLFEGKIWVERIRVDGLDLTITERGGGPPSTHAPDYSWLSKLPAVHVEATQARGNRFTYAVTEKGHRAYLTFHSIDADAGPFGTRPDLSPEYFDILTRASQGSSAQIKLNVRIGLFEREKIDDIRIEARDARLKDLETFFVPDENLHLSGIIHTGNATIRVRKRKLTQQMLLDYEGLKVDFVAGKDHSPIGTFFKNFVASSVIHKVKRLDGSAGDPMTEITVEQEPTAGVFKFLLEGLKEGASAIVKSR